MTLTHDTCFSNLFSFQVIFFSRANGQLKQKNEELERMFIQAQAQIAARNGTNAATTSAAASEGVQDIQEGHQCGGGGELKIDDAGAVKANADEVNDTADMKEEGNNSADIPQGDTLLATAGGEQEQTATDTQPQQQQQQQQEVTNIPFPSMVQQPIPFTAVPGGAAGAAAPAMDPNTMMYMLMMSGNPLANTMMAANPMMALQMFNQLNAATAGAMTGGVVPNQQQQQQQQQPQATTQGANATAAVATTAAAPTAFPAMPVGVGNNVIMPTPGGAFNPFGGFPATAAGTTNTEVATAAATAAEGDSPNAAADVTEEVNV